MSKINNNGEYHEALDRIAELENELDIESDMFKQDALLDEIDDIQDAIDEFLNEGIASDPHNVD